MSELQQELNRLNTATELLAKSVKRWHFRNALAFGVGSFFGTIVGTFLYLWLVGK